MAGGISISPAVINLEPGGSYKLVVENLSESEVELQALPVALAVNNADNKLVLVSDSKIQNPAQLGQNLVISNPLFKLAAGQKVVLNIDYKQELTGFYLGTAIKQASSQGQRVGVSGQLVSSIVPTTLSEKDMLAQGNNLEVIPWSRIGSINIGNSFATKSQIENGSNRAVKPSAEINLLFGEKRVNNMSLTQQLPTQLLPGSKAFADGNLTDSRPFWQRIGYHNFQQVVVVDGKSVVAEQAVLSIPIEFIGIVLILLAVFTASTVAAIRKIRQAKFVADKKTAKIL